jgi:hypothetical protein
VETETLTADDIVKTIKRTGFVAEEIWNDDQSRWIKKQPWMDQKIIMLKSRNELYFNFKIYSFANK